MLRFPSMMAKNESTCRRIMDSWVIASSMLTKAQAWLAHELTLLTSSPYSQEHAQQHRLETRDNVAINNMQIEERDRQQYLTQDRDKKEQSYSTKSKKEIQRINSGQCSQKNACGKNALKCVVIPTIPKKTTLLYSNSPLSRGKVSGWPGGAHVLGEGEGSV